MKILITGASGFIGSALAKRMLDRGHLVDGWQHRTPLPAGVNPIRHLDDLTQHYDVMVNLAGASIAGGLWTESRRQVLRDSRIAFTRQLLDRLGHHGFSVGHLISGSAIGYYGTGAAVVTENSEPGDDFSAQLTRDWEAAAQAAEAKVERLTWVRTGLVLGRDGGLLPMLARPAYFGLATRLGNGEQGQSWIHRDDWLAAVDLILEHGVTGAVNLTAPSPVSQDTFNRQLSQTLHRPYWMRFPSGPLRWMLGDLSTLVLDGQYVAPQRLLDQGFEFQYPTLGDALTQLYS
ncbi:TIGR01777 family protein [Saccharospirillum sp. MSK14-1]|uniref:TIGR01777 family oxidoreductase n=1 Tax=Saccharospirillum sp. MSK14-1 TaxID=1897632 RepID=UPI000D3B0673|nr:TIGR01777 family oxidoreductase [Saccharospirillum sp. MSK14-1]PTY37228.1 TIGR01777 family protein [Saccharospirillum sp. MSK14-1]